MIKNLVKKSAELAGYKIEKIRKTIPGPELILFDFAVRELIALKGDSLKFIEIGANDGVNEDPLYPWLTKYDWSGLLVEPQPLLCEKLNLLYASKPKIKIIQGAIGPEKNNLELWCVKSAEIDDDVTGIASLSKDYILKHKHRIKNLEQRLYTINVPVITFGELVEQYNMLDLDILQIDAEGYDYEILKSINLEKVTPYIINYEHCNLSIDLQHSCREYLRQYGYVFGSYLGDTLAVKSALLPASLDRKTCRV